ncbi:hypothetical protein [Microbulbifer hydrolyticus]|uniref:Chemotaxis protein n=1 Tax=Microbulbifer hydrolyticus TaxID=48074 RepID=A0A6P1TEY4_9GAMM|nr:hypothetical protein [Microbulbifer hydrolyticus]MBB5212578.1 hypothetical protein [Microbulbifer hydrolyticus]QHQ40195.1 hypothetical protein GTQ55_15210 [Microbulbifer hydrolyticus]
MADLVILAAPGMGAVDEGFAEPLFQALKSELGDDWSRIHADTVLCQGHLQPNLERVFEAMQKRDMDYLRARKFMLYGLAEAASQMTDIDQRGGNYDKTQQAIYQTFERAAKATSDTAPVILLSHSIGCSILSNYLWDAQRPTISHGIWRDGGPKGVHKGSAKDLFQRGKTLAHWYTLGASNPLWTAGMARDQIQAVTSDTRGYNFRWKNFYNPDDLFGWPLKPLSPSYNQAVYRDYETRPLADWSAASWGPQLVSHDGYWQSELVQKALIEDVRELLKKSNSRRPSPLQRATAAAI